VSRQLGLVAADAPGIPGDRDHHPPSVITGVFWLLSLHNLPNTSDLEFLHDKDLIQICVGQYQIIFNFVDGITISVESGIAVKVASEEIEQIWKPGTKFEAQNLFQLLGKPITNYEVLDANALRLMFGEPGEIRILTHEQYESYTITAKGLGTLVV
jgi:hypothetical protein